MFRVAVWLNPLDLEEDRPPTADETLAYMASPGLPIDPKSIERRYREISEDQPPLVAPPVDDRILGQLIWPLRHAKACYIVGNYLGTIALSGIVAEMSAILLFDLAEPTVNDKPMTDKDQERLYGRPFEKLGQDRRIEVLQAHQALSRDVADAFNRIRGTRRQHLHLASLANPDAVARDARMMFRDAVTIVRSVIGQDVRDGKLVFTPQMTKYLDRQGKVVRPTSSEPPTGEPEG